MNNLKRLGYEASAIRNLLKKTIIEERKVILREWLRDNSIAILEEEMRNDA